MYLIHFSKNIIKIHFPKVGCSKVQTHFRRLIFISEGKEKAHSTQNCMHYNRFEPDLKKIIINDYYIYIDTNFDFFLYNFLNIFLKINENEN